LKKYSRVSYEVRCQISALLQVKLSIPEIALRLGFNKSTIYREIKRNSIKASGSFSFSYNSLRAHKLAKNRYSRCKRKSIITANVEKIIQSALKEGWSPEQVSGRIKKEKLANISHETVYRYTRNNPEYKRYLRWNGRRGYGRYRQRKAKPAWMKNIKLRPPIVNKRKRIGDWERDSMYIKDRKTLLVLTDRKSRYTLIDKLETHTAKIVADKTSKLLKQAGRKVFTITNDNGGEFRFKSPEEYKVYWCDPHKPQQRGTVENTIGTIRRYVKKDTDIKDIDLELLNKLINLKPRKVLDYKTPYEVFFNKKVALAH